MVKKQRYDFSYCNNCKCEYPRSMFYTRKNGVLIKPLCKTCHRKQLVQLKDETLRPYRAFVEQICKICGFEGHPCQLDVNHIDGNHSNNHSSNLETLCANCHRLVTYKQILKKLERSEGVEA